MLCFVTYSAVFFLITGPQLRHLSMSIGQKWKKCTIQRENRATARIVGIALSFPPAA